MSRAWAFLLPLLPLAGIAVMLVFMVERRWRRKRWFALRDRLRREWLEQLPALLAGAPIDPIRHADRDTRETLEILVLDRLEVASGDEATRLRALLERAGFLDRHVDWLRRGKHWQRLYSASLLGRAGAKLAIPALLDLLSNPSHELRGAAARALAAIGNPRIGSALVKLAAGPSLPIHPSLWLRVTVDCRTPAAELVSLLRDDRAAIRAMAARALAEMPEPAAFEQVEQFAFDPDEEVRAQIARLLGRTADPRAAPLLAGLAKDPVWFVRLRALAAIGDLNRPECLEAVLAGTRDPHFQVRTRAASTLGRLAVEPLSVLGYLLTAGDRYGLEAYLSLLGRSGLLWRTIALLRSPNAEERATAGKLLGAALKAGATQEFVYALEAHPDPRVRLRVARLLAQHGTPRLLPALKRVQSRVSSPREQRVVTWLRGKLQEAESAQAKAEKPHALADRV